MCFFNPKIETPKASVLPPATKPTPTIAQTPKAKKLDTDSSTTAKVDLSGGTKKAALVAKAVGADDLKIPINKDKTGTKTGGLNIG